MTQQDALRKAMACLRLAKSANEHEAALAAARAQEIIIRYQLDVNDLDFDSNQAAEDKEEVRDYGYEDPLDHVKYGGYRETWCVRLAGVVSRANQCRILYQRQHDRSRKIQVIGRPSDVQAVRYLYSFFKIQIEELVSLHCKGNSGPYVGQFCTGVIDTLSAKLYESRKAVYAAKQSEVNGMALVRVNQAIARIEKRSRDVEKFIEGKFPKLGTARGGFSKTNTGGRAAGQKAGESLRMTGAKGSLGAGRKEIQ